ncbi:MAG: exopolysaccharide biosynthesis polyprenyl glycosylphosphotransferase [Eubacteriales bacterium]|nr:exopolysaccharide biosynthesis polyprenyl glycosylphosphotransferase [Eubacteriales bacterium]
MENKKVTHTARSVLRLWNTGWFAFVWIAFYNKFMFDNHRVFGAIISTITFYVIYSFLCGVYKAFRIASTDVGEIVFSQFVSFGAADLILYMECCLVFNVFLNLLPGMAIVCIQLLGTMAISLYTKRYFMRHVATQKTLVIYGSKRTKEDAVCFEKRLLRKYSHLFDILFTESEMLSDQVFYQRVAGVETIIMYDVSHERRAHFTTYCLELKKNFYYTPDIQDVLEMGCETKHLLDTSLMKYEYRYENRGRKVVKRTMDIFFSLFFILLFSPAMLVICIAIKLEDGGPVFYKQKRCTQNGREFDILKFRSMKVDAEKYGVIPSTEDDPRITKVGKKIRALRLDEVPQFFNILKGDMAFVGPRPERVEHVEMYMAQLPEFRYRMSVKGGLTGYAQVFGKYNTSAYDKLLMDLMYIENQSLLLDLKITLLTIRTVFQKESTEGFEESVSQSMTDEIGGK